MKRRRKEHRASEIDISPLIDCVFILLIFFMVTSNFVKDMKVDIERPGAASAEKASNKALRIAIDSNSVIFVDGTPVRPWMVQSRVREFLEGSGSDQVLIVTDRRVPAERLIEVVDQCRLAGAQHVGVASEKEAA
jgi:biopolymer transport protein ExbD